MKQRVKAARLRQLAQRLPEGPRQSLKRASTLRYRGDLDRVARAYRTDKATTDHGYTTYYSRHLPPRGEVTRLLEIGIGGDTSWSGYDTTAGGASLRVWQDYYPKARIVGLDLHAKVVPGPRIVTERGSQDDPQVLAGIVERHGPFDVIIDDGSHVGRHQHASFAALFSALRPGGVYVIEDLATAYREDYEGGPPGTAGTSATLLQQSVDAVLRQHWQGGSRAPDVAELHVYDQIAFLTRAGCKH